MKADDSYMFSHQVKERLVFLTNTLIEFILLLTLQSYTEDYQQDKEPKW